MSFKTYLFLGFFANPSQESAQTVENDFGKNGKIFEPNKDHLYA